ncbi:hypothetical protein ET418_13485 [Oryzomonas rubra]|uniref:Porin n=2 Tax=Oryzomonas rubra TaxID=2509454 RepID=A0A5A9X9Y9_9BACT|nr:hypothetical protein ET418_13485 [Oryzomonas rubra]
MGTRRGFRSGVGQCAGIIMALVPLLAAAPVQSEGLAVSGESTTILRARESMDKKDLYPAYEYLRLSATNLDKEGRLSFYFGGWGRIDLGDRSTDKYRDGDLQYGYLSYRAPKNNLVVNLGRQFVAEGVASERVDGAYLRSDFTAGFGAAAFIGAPVVTETNSKGGDLIYGGRITHTLAKYYTLGVSALKASQSGERYREEEGVDVWLHPLKQIDAVGRSSYNSITDGWMEHDYRITYNPQDNLSINASYSDINYKDYFFHMTTNVFSLISPANPGGVMDPREKVQSLGGGIAYTPIKALTIGADYKNYDYKIAGDGNYYGGKATLLLPGAVVTGFAIHRMDGTTDKLRYNEYRVFAAKKFQRFDITADFFDVNYDSRINGIKNSYTVVGAASCDITPSLKIGADVDYSKNPDYDNEVAGLVKLTYTFDIRRGTEGRAK